MKEIFVIYPNVRDKEDFDTILLDRNSGCIVKTVHLFGCLYDSYCRRDDDETGLMHGFFYDDFWREFELEPEEFLEKIPAGLSMNEFIGYTVKNVYPELAIIGVIEF